MSMILSLYLTLMPVILAGIANMIFCKSSLLDSVNQPIDAGRLLGDGRRLFGANKTWKGFWGMVFWGLLDHRVKPLRMLGSIPLFCWIRLIP